MATSYTNIYSRAINELDDPKITSAYETNPIDFFKIMYGYLSNAIPLFITPIFMISILQDTTPPSEQTEIFDGDGLNNVFTLSTIPPVGAYFYVVVDGSPVAYSYNSILNQITTITIPLSGTNNVSIEWYFAGQFNQDLQDREERISSYLLVECWGEKEKNFLLDIRRLLNDTDYRLGAESANINSKGNWYHSMREQAEKEMNKYAWDIYNNEKRKKYGMAQIGGVRIV